MGKTKRFWVPYAPYDIEGLKYWLEEKALEGYRLKVMKSYFAVFEESDREELKYHLEPTVKDSHKPRDEIVETRSARGWTYAGTVPNHFHVFRALAGTPDFHQEGQALRWKLEEKLKKEKRSMLWQILGLLFVIIAQMGVWNIFRNPVRWIIEEFSLLHLLFFVPLLFGVITQYKTYRNHKRIIERMDNGPDSYNLPGEGFRAVEFIGQGVMIAAVIAVGFSTLLDIDQQRSFASDINFEEYPIIALEEIERAEDPVIDENTFIQYFNELSSTESIFLKEKLYLYQSVSIGRAERYSSGLTANYYSLRTEYVLEFLLEEIDKEIKDLTGKNGEDEIIDEINTVYYGGRNQYLVINDSNQILVLKYSGRADLSRWKEEIILKLISYEELK